MPGPQGAAGANGTNGTDGLDAYAIAVGGEAMPAEAATVTVATSTDTSWMSVGQIVYVEFWGYMEVTALPTTTSVTLENIEDTATGAYDSNAAPGTVLPALATISPGGLQGPTGTTDTALFLQVANNLNDVADVATSRSNLGLGTAALLDEGTANGELPKVDDAGGLTAGEAVFATADGVESLTAANARTALGLGTAAVEDVGTADNEVPQVDDAAGLTADEAIFATASGLKSVDAATARSLLGISGSSLDMLLFRQQELTTVNGGDFNAGSWQVVPINTEVVDTGNNGSIAGNVITLSAGSYRYSYGVVGYEVGGFQARLYQTSAPAAVVPNSYSCTGYAPVNPVSNQSVVTGVGRFTIAGSETFQLEAISLITKAASGFGLAVGVGVGEVYSWISLEKE